MSDIDADQEPTQYVSMGSKDRLSFTMHKKTFSATLIAGIIFLGFLLIVIIISTILISVNFTKLKRTPKRTPKNKTPASSFTKIGLPESLSITIKNNTKEQDQDSCALQCNENCSGFYFDNGQCTTFSEEIILEDTKYHDKQFLFIKNEEDVFVDKKIFLGRFNLPSEFWKKSSGKNYIQLDLGTVTKINFVPNHIKMSKKYTGIYSKYKFTLDQLQIISTRDSTYIHHPETELDIPWKDSNTLYVVYFEKN